MYKTTRITIPESESEESGTVVVAIALLWVCCIDDDCLGSLNRDLCEYM